jgi:serine/threonine protein kinase
MSFNFLDVSLHDKKHMERIMKEIESLRRLDHPNIIKLLNVFKMTNSIVLVMDYAAGGELYSIFQYYYSFH